MLAANYRLKDRRAIAGVMRRGRNVSTEAALVKCAANHLQVSRAVVVVSKKVSKKAVVRNRIRRRVAAILAETWQTVTPGYDIVVTVRQDVSEATPAHLSKEIIAGLTKAGLIST